MLHSHRVVFVGSLLLATGLAQSPISPPLAPPSVPTPGFVPNRGQWPDHVHGRGSFGPLVAWVQADGWTLQAQWREEFDPTGDRAGLGSPATAVHGAAIAMRFPNAAVALRSAPTANAARHHFLFGNDPKHWVTDVLEVPSVQLVAVAPGVDAVVRCQDRTFEYDLHVAPGASLAEAVIRCQGIDGLAIDPDGSLRLRTAVGDFRQLPPVAWTDTAGHRQPVPCSVQLVDATSFRFVAPQRSLDAPLVVDPGIVWSLPVGSSADDVPNLTELKRDAAGNVYVSGLTVGSNFPTTLGAYQATSPVPGTQKAWLASFSPAGALLWSTHLGGTTGIERATAICVSASGVVTATGTTTSNNFPTVNAFDASYNGTGAGGWGDTWFAQFDPAQSGAAQLQWSTYLGGSGDDRSNSLHLAANGEVTASGWTGSSNMPGVTVVGAFQPVFAGSQDGFVLRLQPSLPPAQQLLYFTFLGGTGQDYAVSTMVDGNGVISIAGGSNSTNFPTRPGAYSQTRIGGLDCVFARLDPSLPAASQLTWGTYLGSVGDDVFGSAALTADGRVTGAAAGYASFPTTPGAADTTFNGSRDMLVFRLDPTLAGASQLVWSTFVGGLSEESPNCLTLDPSGGVIVGGFCYVGSFPTTATAQQPTFAGGTGSLPFDGVVARLDRTGSTLLYASYLGGSTGNDTIFALGMEEGGDVFATGFTTSNNFPVTLGAPAGLADAFLVRLSLLPPSVDRYGTPTAGCPATPQASASLAPQRGNSAFGLTCLGAPPTTLGLLGWSNAASPIALPILGVDVWIDPTASLLLIPLASDAFGSTFVPVPIPNDPLLQGASIFTQFLFLQPCPHGDFNSSTALGFTIL